ncbi:DNA methyltransferase [Anaeroselena agilis]|uniref:DNA methyltransferase n=1 Tax=Anaeroselena agilis TaxID=3063788 RepID=A0ABU3P417_9FIRM|nr:DNA methyltransferase [Selenomonadales bacterium 4137-cl]
MILDCNKADSAYWTSLQDNVSCLDWEFHNANTQYLTHNLHRYSGKFIPQIARQAIELLSSPEETVLDIYVGSGTTLVEAVLAGRHSIGIDLNPLAALISKVKITPIPMERLEKLTLDFRFLIERLAELDDSSLFAKTSNISLGLQQDSRLTDPWFTKWYQLPVLKELIVIHQNIKIIEDKDCRDLALVAFSDIVRRSSNAHNGYPNVMFHRDAKPRPLPGGLFLKSLYDCIQMVQELMIYPFSKYTPEIILGDAANIPLSNSSIDAIVTHPPYIGSIPYAEYGSLSLKWLGYEPKALDEKLTGGRRQSKDVVERFCNSYQKAMLEAFRVLKPGRSMFMMVGNPLVKGEIVDLGSITKELATIAGFNLIAETTRAGVNRRANKMGTELLLFFQKP